MKPEVILSDHLYGIVSPAVTSQADALADAYRHASPFEHVVIENFFDIEFASKLLAEFAPFEKGNRVGDDGHAGGKSTFERVKTLGDSYRALDETIQSPEFLALIGKITGIDGLLYDPFYLGGGTHENRNGQMLHTHVDFNYHPSERWHRRLNLIVYLNPEWEESWGGNLQLYRNPYEDKQALVRIVPIFNHCVIFATTEKSWHAFDQISLPRERSNLSRKSIALYFYSKDRPQEEVAGKHTTHYVNQQLPERIVAGYQLTDADAALLRELIMHRDNQLQNLYAENAQLLQAQERGLSGKLIYLMKRLYVRYRR